MSVIYETLKKLRSQAEHRGISGIELENPTKSPMKRHWMLTSSLALLIILVGLGLPYGIGQLINEGDRTPKAGTIVSVKIPPEQIENRASAASEAELSVTQGTTGGSVSATTVAKIDGAATDAQFIAAGADNRAIDRIGDEELGLLKRNEPSTSTSPPIDSTDRRDNPVDKNPNEAPEPSPGNLDKQAARQGTVVSRANSANETSGREAVKRISKLHQDKTLKINRIIRQIKQAIDTGHEQDVVRGLAELETFKGGQDSFVRKLRAYWYIRKGDLQAARPLLKSVLQENSEDLEAGVNLAIIDIKAQNFDAARQRLEKLIEIYPENATIGNVLRTLQQHVQDKKLSRKG